MMQDLQANVSRGVALLDERRPGWEQEIDTDTLDINRTDACILGQLYRGSYGEGVLDLFGWTDWSDQEQHGFDSHYGIHNAELTQAWCTVVLERLHA